MSYGTTTDNEYTGSGCIWIPYVLLLIYLYSEHYVRGRNVQSYIILLLAIGAMFRCIWFFLAPDYGVVLGVILISRLAILFQFSAISILILMWSRAIKISQWTDREYYEGLRRDGDTKGKFVEITHSAIIATNTDEQLSSKDNSISSMNVAATNISMPSVISRNITDVIAAFKIAHQTAMSKISSEKVFKGYVTVTIIVNILVWLLLLFTSAIGNSDYWYNFNIIAISSASAVASLVTLFEGLRISMSLQKTLSPVYVYNEGSSAHVDRETGRCDDCFESYSPGVQTCLGCCGIFSLFRFVFQSQLTGTNACQGLYMQKEVLKMILSVSFVISFFCLIRSFGFMYRPVVVE